MTQTPAQSAAAKRWFFIAGILIILAALALIYWSPRKFQSDQDIVQVPPDSTSPEAEIKHLEHLWAEHPTHAPIALRLATLYSDKEDYPKAVEYYREFLRTDTSATGWEVRLDLARVLYASGKAVDARTELKWILDRYPNHAAALYNLGAIEANTGRPGAAKPLWEMAAKDTADPQSAMLARNALMQLNAKKSN